MSDTDDYIRAINKFEKLRHEYSEWTAQADHILYLLRCVDEAANTDSTKVPGEKLRPGVGTTSSSIS